MHFQPAYLVVYLDTQANMNGLSVFDRAMVRKWLGEDQANLRTYSLEGAMHFGSSKQITLEKLPLLLFQLCDAGYTIEPNLDVVIGTKSFYAFSPEFVRTMREKANHATS